MRVSVLSEYKDQEVNLKLKSLNYGEVVSGVIKSVGVGFLVLETNHFTTSKSTRVSVNIDPEEVFVIYPTASQLHKDIIDKLV